MAAGSANWLGPAHAAWMQGRLREVEKACRAALKSSPSDPDALVLLAGVEDQRGKALQAIRLLEKARRARPDDPTIPFNSGLILDKLGRSEQALENFRESSRIDPTYFPALLNTAESLSRLERLEDALQAFDAAESAQPGHPGAAEGRGVALLRLGRAEQALEPLGQAVEHMPEAFHAHSNLAGALMALGRNREAAESLARAVAIQPDNSALQGNLAVARYLADDFEGALSACDRADDLPIPPARAVAVRAMTLGELGRVQEAESLTNPDDWLFPSAPAAPKGFTDAAGFRDALCDELLSHPSLMNARPTKTTMLGSQTDELKPGDGPALKAFHKMAMTEIGSLRSTLAGRDPAGVSAPIRRWPDRTRLRVWGTVLGAGGHQAPHHHPDGVLSGVYYARLPDVVARASSDQAGWIEFGTPTQDFLKTWRPQTKRIAPEEGLMMLFPSHLWHRTLPFDSETKRISVAFDLIPA